MDVVITHKVDETRLRLLRSVWSQLLAPPEDEAANPSVEIDDEDWSEAA